METSSGPSKPRPSCSRPPQEFGPVEPDARPARHTCRALGPPWRCRAPRRATAFPGCSSSTNREAVRAAPRAGGAFFLDQLKNSRFSFSSILPNDHGDFPGEAERYRLCDARGSSRHDGRLVLQPHDLPPNFRRGFPAPRPRAAPPTKRTAPSRAPGR